MGCLHHRDSHCCGERFDYLRTQRVGSSASLLAMWSSPLALSQWESPGSNQGACACLARAATEPWPEPRCQSQGLLKSWINGKNQGRLSWLPIPPKPGQFHWLLTAFDEKQADVSRSALVVSAHSLCVLGQKAFLWLLQLWRAALPKAKRKVTSGYRAKDR